MERYQYSPLHTLPSHRKEARHIGDIPIRLVRLLPGHRSEDVEIEIFHQEGISGPGRLPYQALSYVWGLPERTHIIKVRGSSNQYLPMKSESPHLSCCPDNQDLLLPITYNLSVALQHLRHLEKPKILWIDSICINQDDMLERNNEVLNMGIIFSQAELVLIWLGPDEHNSTNALQALHKNGLQEIERSQEKTSSLNVAEQQLAGENTKSWIAIKHLLSRPWFTRLWVFQEIVLSRYALVIVGEASIPWRFLMSALEWISPRTQAMNLAVKGLDLVPFHQTTIGGFIGSSKYSSLSMMRAVCNTSKLSCLDPRDRLFAIRSLLDSSEQEYIVPDYAQSVEKVYTTTTLRWLQQELDALSLCRLSKAHSTLELPSWVPNFSLPQSNRALRPQINSFGYHFHTNPFFEYNEINDNLTVQGVHMATLSYTEPLNFQQSNTVPSIIATLQNVLDTWTEKNSGLARPSLKSLVNVMLLGEDPSSTVEEIAQEIGRHKICSGKLQAHSRMSDDFLSVRDKMIERALFNTVEGVIGECPETAQCGDVVVQVIGLNDPILLRSVIRTGKRNYQIVGTCYIPGFMQVEAVLGPLPSDYLQHTIDPRLSTIPLPRGWRISQKMETIATVLDMEMFDWDPDAPLVDYEDCFVNADTLELRHPSDDPRKDAEALKKRGIPVKDFVLF